MAKGEQLELYDDVPDGFVAVLDEPKLKPAFTVKRLNGEVPHEVHLFDKEENRIKRKVIMEPAGFLVTFAKGHSIRCRDEAHLKRVGAGRRMIPVVNTETGEVKGHVPNPAAMA